MTRAAIAAFSAWASCQGGRAEPNHPADATPIAVATPEAAEHPSARKCFDEPGMAYIPETVRSGRRRHHYVNGDNDNLDVELAPFWLDRHEVAAEEFRACVNAGACKRPYVPKGALTDSSGNPMACSSNIEGVPNLPINCIRGADAYAYCAWRGKRVPLGYEWTWAAQGRDEQRKYPWGDDPPSCELTIASAEDTEEGCGLGRPWPVGSRPGDVSRDGVFDLGGNVSEIAVDQMPDDPPFDVEYATGGEFVQFGGSWQTPATAYSSLRDLPLEPWFSDREGFRCAKDPGPVPPCSVAD